MTDLLDQLKDARRRVLTLRAAIEAQAAERDKAPTTYPDNLHAYKAARREFRHIAERIADYLIVTEKEHDR